MTKEISIFDRGRPPSRDWLTLKGDITDKLVEGWGYQRLARVYGLSTSGMRSVIKKLGLATIRSRKLNH